MHLNDKTKLPWAEKYRPTNLDQIMSHKDIKLALKSFIVNNSMPNMLFSGPTGSGKTSAIKACAREMYGEYYGCMVNEINASSERGIDVVRSKIKTFSLCDVSVYLPNKIKNLVKLVILDEIDSMTGDAQLLLRQVIEKYNTRYCIICNDVDKIDIALQSRCAHFRFYPLKPSEMAKKLTEIATNEGVVICENSLAAIMNISKGDMRAAINILQHVSLTKNNNITVTDIYAISGHCMPGIIIKIFKKLVSLHNDELTLNETINYIYEYAIDNNITMYNMLDELHKLVITSDFDNHQKIYIIGSLARCQVYDSVNVDIKITIMIIASLFLLIN